MIELNTTTVVPSSSEEIIPFGSKPISETEGYFVLGFAILVVFVIWGGIVKVILDDIKPRHRF